jgi:hypothetical protein
MRSLSGSISKLVAVAATLTVSIAVPALLVQVGAIDAVGRELATPAPRGVQVVIASTQAKPVAVQHHVARHVRATVRPQHAVVRSRTPVRALPRATRISNPVAVHTATPPATPPTTTTPTTTTPSTPATPTTPSTPTTTTTVPPPFTTTVPPAAPPVTLPPPPQIVVVNVPPPLGTDVFNDGNPIAVAVTVKANIYAPPPTMDGPSSTTP